MGLERKLNKDDFHLHIKVRMFQRGITEEEVEQTLQNGWDADDAKTETSGKVFVFTYNKEWEGKFYKEKEVRVYYKYVNDNLVLLTAKAKYGDVFLRGG